MATFKGDKLIGKTNYIEWHSNASLFLEINGYMPYIDGTEAAPNKALYYKSNTDNSVSDIPYSPELGIKYIEKELDYQRNSKKALGAIKSIISTENIDRFKDKPSAKALWEAIVSTYGESSLELISRYLNRIIDSNYSSFASIDEYTSQIQSSALYLKELGYELPRPIIASLIFKGLPSSFDAIASRKYEELARDIANIDISKLISELISEEARMSSNIDLEANKANNRPKKGFCTHCNQKGHIEPKCWIKYPELRKDLPSNSSNKRSKKAKYKPNNRGTKNESSKAVMSTLSAIKGGSNYRLILDSGATEHYTPTKEWLIDYKVVKNKTIIVANGTKVPIEGIGNIPIKIGNTSVLIKGVNYVPSLKSTLISSKELTNKGWTILFKDNAAELSNSKFKLNLKAKWEYNAYYLDTVIDHKTLEPVVYQVTSATSELDLIHKRLNHLSKDYLIKTLDCTKGLEVKDSKHSSLDNCDSCYIGKFTKIGSKEPFKPTSNLIYFDVDIAGPFKAHGLKGERYFLTITDRGTRAIWVYPIKYKSDALDTLIAFYKVIETQFNTKIKAFRLDNAKEFKSSKWSLFCTNKGIICEYTSPYSAPQNGISERLNRYLVERLIAVCKEKAIPLFLWPHLVQAIAHIKNRTYNPIINKTPYEALIGSKPNIAYIKTLGSLAYTLIPKEKRDGKLDNRANKGILVGFESSNNFLVYIPSLDTVVSTKDILIKEDLVYKDEYTTKEDYSQLLDDIKSLELDSNIESNIELDSTKKSTLDYNQNSNIEENSELEGEDTSNVPIEANNKISQPDQLDDEPAELDDIDELNSEYYSNNDSSKRASKRLKGDKPANNGLSIYQLASQAYFTTIEENKEDPTTINNRVTLPYAPDIVEPKTFTEASNSTYKEYWHKAEEKELDSLTSNNTWDLVPRPKDAKVLNTRWVYKTKRQDQIVELKARFVAKGFEQLYGLDYIDTFASVIKQLAWRLLFALAVLNSWFIYKIDMISAFTQGLIDISIYIRQPPGHLDPKYPDYVLRLNKALYGLKQSARIWFYTLKDVLIKELGFVNLINETSIFIHKDLNIIISLYVDDLAIIAPDQATIKNFILRLKKHFKLKDLGLIKDYLGVEIDYDYDKGTLKLSQTKYLNKVLERFNISNKNPKYTPIKATIKLEPNKEQAKGTEIKWFQAAIGSLLYLAMATRPDIAYSVILLARYSTNPGQEHIAAVNNLFKYLSKTKELGIVYTRENNIDYISGYCDADYAGDIASAKSTSGYIFYIANGPVTWKSKLQSIIAQSTTEAEYIAINIAAKEAVYIKSLLKELGLYKQSKLPLYTDNNGALLLAKNPIFHERTKHIAVKYHYIRDLINKGIIDLIYISTKEQKADGFTKALERIKFGEFIRMLGLN
jgi:Reverse transcriptase (RNA-dependent DNA polymerase)/gag-polypeptide of LTR copia-type/Integrase core domain